MIGIFCIGKDQNDEWYYMVPQNCPEWPLSTDPGVSPKWATGCGPTLSLKRLKSFLFVQSWLLISLRVGTKPDYSFWEFGIGVLRWIWVTCVNCSAGRFSKPDGKWGGEAGPLFGVHNYRQYASTQVSREATTAERIKLTKERKQKTGDQMTYAKK